MKHTTGFVFFICSWGIAILQLPDLAEKVGKWSPILESVANTVDSIARGFATIMPTPPDTFGPIGYFTFWPNWLLSIPLVAIIFLLVFASRWAEERFLQTEDSQSSYFTATLVVVSAISCAVPSWLLSKTSELTVIQSFGELPWWSQYELSGDKAYFLYGTWAYMAVIFVTGFLLYILLCAAYWHYKEGAEARKNPNA